MQSKHVKIVALVSALGCALALAMGGDIVNAVGVVSAAVSSYSAIKP